MNQIEQAILKILRDDEWNSRLLSLIYWDLLDIGLIEKGPGIDKVLSIVSDMRFRNLITNEGSFWQLTDHGKQIAMTIK